MNIVSLSIKNFLSIGDVTIFPGQINQIVGQNNQGKTTVLKAIEFAVKGGADPQLVKFGQDHAEVIVELDDQTIIKRRLSASGKQSVDIKKDGFRAPTPQSYLDALFESSAFNPLDLLDAKKRNDAILSSIDIKVDEARLQQELNDSPYIKIPMPPLDYSAHGLKVIDQAHKYFYQRRAEANKDAADKKRLWEIYFADLPKDEVLAKTNQQIQLEVDTLESARLAAASEVSRIREAHRKMTAATEKLNRYRQAADQIDKEIANYESSINALKARRSESDKWIEDAKKDIPPAIEDDGPALLQLGEAKVSIERAKAQFKDVERFESIGKQRTMVDSMKNEYEESQRTADWLTQRVEKLAGPIKHKLMAETELPIKGLQYDFGGFKIDGVSVDQLSSSKSIGLAIGIARKLAKKTKLICLDGAEALDEQTYAALHAEIKDDGFVYFITRVGEAFQADGDTVIKMQNGEVSK